MIFKDYKKFIYLIFLFIAFVIITFIIKYYFKPFLSIIILLMLSSPLYKLLKRIHINKNIAAALSLLLVNIFGILIILYLGNTIIYFFREIYYSNVEVINEFISQMAGVLNIDFNHMKFFESFLSFFKQNGLNIRAVSTGENLISNVTHNILAYFIANICCFFILVDKEKFYQFIKVVFPKNIVNKSLKEKDNFFKMIKIQGILAAVSVLEIMAGFFILRIDHSFVLSIVCGVLDLLPYVGTIIVFVPIIIYNIIMKKYIISFGLICLYILVMIIREILEAKFLSSGLNIHPLVILLSLYIGINLFGVLGIVCGPLYSIFAKEIVFYDMDKS